MMCHGVGGCYCAGVSGGGMSQWHDKQAIHQATHGAAAFVMLFDDGLDGCFFNPPRRTGAGTSTRVMLSVMGEPALKKIG